MSLRLDLSTFVAVLSYTGKAARFHKWQICRRSSSCPPVVAVQREALKLSRKNNDMRPFEPGGETHLEHLARKADCGMFVLDSHSKKRPHNLILGRCALNTHVPALAGVHRAVWSFVQILE